MMAIQGALHVQFSFKSHEAEKDCAVSLASGQRGDFNLPLTERHAAVYCNMTYFPEYP